MMLHLQRFEQTPLKIHTDSKTKIITALIYLNSKWVR